MRQLKVANISGEEYELGRQFSKLFDTRKKTE